MTNEDTGNAVVAFRRSARGRLSYLGTFDTGGLGSGGGLGNQGGLVRADNCPHRLRENRGGSAGSREMGGTLLGGTAKRAQERVDLVDAANQLGPGESSSSGERRSEIARLLRRSAKANSEHGFSSFVRPITRSKQLGRCRSVGVAEWLADDRSPTYPLGCCRALIEGVDVEVTSTRAHLGKPRAAKLRVLASPRRFPATKTQDRRAAEGHKREPI